MVIIYLNLTYFPNFGPSISLRAKNPSPLNLNSEYVTVYLGPKLLYERVLIYKLKSAIKHIFLLWTKWKKVHKMEMIHNKFSFLWNEQWHFWRWWWGGGGYYWLPIYPWLIILLVVEAWCTRGYIHQCFNSVFGLAKQLHYFTYSTPRALEIHEFSPFFIFMNILILTLIDHWL